MNIKVGIVGLGYWGPHLLRNFIAQPLCTLVYACDLQQSHLTKIKAHYPSITTTTQYSDLLEDASLDLILVATPTETHYTLAKAALEHGKHVFIEKPMATSSAEAEALIQLSRKVDKMIFVDHTFVFAPAVQRISELIHRGDLGDLLYFDSSRINLGLIQKETNVLWDLAIHDLSILSTFVDLSDITTVSAHGSAHFGQQEELAHLHLTFRSDFQAHIAVSWLSPLKIRQTIVAGTQAMVLYDDTQPSEKIRIYDRGIEHDHTKPDPFFPKYRSGDILIPALPLQETLGLEAEHVLACIRYGTKPLVSGQEGLQVLTILEAADRSLEQRGVPIELSAAKRTAIALTQYTQT
ncbi:MAG: hypothetical protein RIQ56_977 [Candidatus Parcubacteria bacterium]